MIEIVKYLIKLVNQVKAQIQLLGLDHLVLIKIKQLLHNTMALPLHLNDFPFCLVQQINYILVQCTFYNLCDTLAHMLFLSRYK